MKSMLTNGINTKVSDINFPATMMENCGRRRNPLADGQTL